MDVRTWRPGNVRKGAEAAVGVQLMYKLIVYGNIGYVATSALGSQVVRADGATAAVGVQLRRKFRLLDLVQHWREQRPRRLRISKELADLVNNGRCGR